ncbi:YugN-like protein [Sinobaca qinghaiensis]|uniref:YugN-like protein n=1 Tax=Sinobaca qinghaiensis TaxID=342944 RepID=A0A419V671_9BACL|nr:YugN family protein [Sinobaca qinghaiensis]RKD75483.1 YugN-like protein [Sinobaca qinghaiensis]
MQITDYEFEGTQITFGRLHRIIKDAGFIHAGQWDYERVTFDYKFFDRTDDATYYLRIPAYAVEGDIPAEDTVVQILTPYFGRHYYPHGIEYDEEFPEKIIQKCRDKTKAVWDVLKTKT